ncbi:hypothetical protein PB1A_1278 [Leuconostoc inhae]|uniref:Uncharacterized protein n=1 Tax=Leuconostoc inhae TaxID=178001 RepID=A0AAN2QV86_9LACO|nr:hypothetical protein LEGAS_0885 [Leuconostoc gasicomitatum LMG 18811]CUR63518.1 Uncharacterized protein LEKG_0931 [Leuconostoc gasicomitatum KG16-1]CUW05034.1 hypothetical protein PB1E_1405 [Leuconostoc gasicomitatum]CUW06243.1 hypothetical protein C120C_0058 [Leuconostoc inhae]CUW09322.1 hypothetical protein KSL4_1534 [Leuconostoc inhae]
MEPRVSVLMSIILTLERIMGGFLVSERENNTQYFLKGM